MFEKRSHSIYNLDKPVPNQEVVDSRSVFDKMRDYFKNNTISFGGIKIHYSLASESNQAIVKTQEQVETNQDSGGSEISQEPVEPNTDDTDIFYNDGIRRVPIGTAEEATELQLGRKLGPTEYYSKLLKTEIAPPESAQIPKQEAEESVADFGPLQEMTFEQALTLSNELLVNLEKKLLENHKPKDLQVDQEQNGSEILPVTSGENAFVESQAQAVKDELTKPEVQNNLWQKVRSKVSAIDLASVAVGATSGAAVRAGLKAALHAHSFGISMGIGAGAGLAVKGSREVFDQYRFGSYDQDFYVLLVDFQKNSTVELIQKKTELENELKTEQDTYGRASLLGGSQKVATITEQLQILDRIIDFKVETKPGKTRVQDIVKFLDTGTRKEVGLWNHEQDPQFDELQSLLEKNRWKTGKIAAAATKGALYGALGAGITNSIIELGSHSGWFDRLGQLANRTTHSTHDHLTQQAGADRLTQLSPENQVIADTAANEASEHARNAGQQVLLEAKNQLSNNSFRIDRIPGDSATIIARKAIHDYAVNMHHLDPQNARLLSTEQMVYAEDMLQKILSHQLTANHNLTQISIDGHQIQEVYDKATQLSADKIHNLKTLLGKPGHVISISEQQFIASDSAHNNFYQKPEIEAILKEKSILTKSAKSGVSPNIGRRIFSAIAKLQLHASLKKAVSKSN